MLLRIHWGLRRPSSVLPMDLSIIIVNWKSKNYLRNCISSILATTHGVEFEILVIDNASFDRCDEMLREHYPKVTFIQSNENLGLAKSNNLTFQASRGDAVCFLNPDTEVVGEALQIMYHYLNTLPKVGAIGCKLLNSDRTLQTSCIRSFPTILNQVLDTEALRQRYPNSRLWGMAALFNGDKSPSEVDAVSGACLMIRRSVFENVAMFSTDYFMYSEDVDLCFKVKKFGWKNYYIPCATVVHHGGGSTAQSKVDTFSSVMMLESRWRFFRNTQSNWYCILYRMAIFSVSVIRIGLVLTLWAVRGPRGRSRSRETVLKKWTSSLRWTLGGERWAKNY
jgi:N-acetylglucosaminyl-diphospho-decaprenol L-rhamnosyltransferase